MKEQDEVIIERYRRLGEELVALQAGENDGRGVTFLRYMADDLKRGDVEAARAEAINQSDKFGQRMRKQ